MARQPDNEEGQATEARLIAIEAQLARILELLDELSANLATFIEQHGGGSSSNG